MYLYIMYTHHKKISIATTALDDIKNKKRINPKILTLQTYNQNLDSKEINITNLQSKPRFKRGRLHGFIATFLDAFKK